MWDLLRRRSVNGMQPLRIAELLDEGFLVLCRGVRVLLPVQALCAVLATCAQVGVLYACVGTLRTDLARSRPDLALDFAVFSAFHVALYLIDLAALGGAAAAFVAPVGALRARPEALGREVSPTLASCLRLVGPGVRAGLAAGVFSSACVVLPGTIVAVLAWRAGDPPALAPLVALALSAAPALGLGVATGLWLLLRLSFTPSLAGCAARDPAPAPASGAGAPRTLAAALASSWALSRGRVLRGLGLLACLVMLGLLFNLPVGLVARTPPFESAGLAELARMLPRLLEVERLAIVLAQAASLLPRAFGLAAWSVFFLDARARCRGVLARRPEDPGGGSP